MDPSLKTLRLGQIQPSDPANRKNTAGSGCISGLVLTILWFYLVFVVLVRIGIEVMLSGIVPDAERTSLVVIPLITSILILIPTLIFSLFWTEPRNRSICKLWAWGAGFNLWLLPVYLLPATAMQARAGFQALFTMLYLLIFILFQNKSGYFLRDLIQSWRKRIGNRALISLSIAGLYAIPWLVIGAFGSLLDTLLQLICGILLGVLATTLVNRYKVEFLPSMKPAEKQSWRSFISAGIIIATAICLLAAGLTYSFGVPQFLLVLSLFPLGWIWFGLHVAGSENDKKTVSNPGYSILLFGLVAAYPLIAFDPDELALITGAFPGEALPWSITAAGISFALGVLLSVLALILVCRPEALRKSMPLSPGFREKKYLAWFAMLIWIIAIACYLVLGQPGFYGDNMLIILENQADFSNITPPADYHQRRNAIYTQSVEFSKADQLPLRKLLTKYQIAFKPFYLLNSIEVSNNPLLRITLSNHSDVNRILESPQLRPLPRPQTESVGKAQPPSENQEQDPMWNLTQTGALRVRQEFGINGAGIVIGIADSGVQWTHPELRQTYRGADGDHNYNWLDPWYGSTKPGDINGHGTHTLGTILGQTTGIANGASWIACANLARNLGNPADYLECMQFLFAPYPMDGNSFENGNASLGADVINNSWGCPKLEGCDSAVFEPALNALSMAGIFFVAAAGNEGPSCSTINDPPAIYDQAFTVGAVDAAGNLAYFSSRGPATSNNDQHPKPNLVAPGVDILSSFPGSSYSYQSGTSMASPHVAGAVALIWSANPNLVGDLEATKQILLDSARPVPGEAIQCTGELTDFNYDSGGGFLDIYEAVKRALETRIAN